MNLTAKYFRRPNPTLLLKIGCPPFLVATTVWKQILQPPVCDWGRPAGEQNGALVVEVLDRTMVDAFRSHEAEICRRLASFGMDFSGLVIRVKPRR